MNQTNHGSIRHSTVPVLIGGSKPAANCAAIDSHEFRDVATRERVSVHDCPEDRLLRASSKETGVFFRSRRSGKQPVNIGVIASGNLAVLCYDLIARMVGNLCQSGVSLLGRQFRNSPCNRRRVGRLLRRSAAEPVQAAIGEVLSLGKDLIHELVFGLLCGHGVAAYGPGNEDGAVRVYDGNTDGRCAAHHIAHFCRLIGDGGIRRHPLGCPIIGLGLGEAGFTGGVLGGDGDLGIHRILLCGYAQTVNPSGYDDSIGPMALNVNKKNARGVDFFVDAKSPSW